MTDLRKVFQIELTVSFISIREDFIRLIFLSNTCMIRMRNVRNSIDSS